MKKEEYSKKEIKSKENSFEDEIDRIAREGARKMLMEALELEVSEYLERNRYERKEVFKGYRNGYGKERSIAIGYGEVKIKPPRVRDIPEGSEGFRSKILTPYQRSSRGVQMNLARLYLEGLSSGDFEPVFRAILGEKAPLSPSSIIRLKEIWEKEYRVWKERPLSDHTYIYLWVDGIYLKAGLEREKTALLVVLGVKEDGTKELLAIKEGYRESKESWGEVLRDLKTRGFTNPLLVVGDGALGIWLSLREVFPEAKEQRCWNHKILNVLNKLPKRLWKEARKRIREIYNAPSRSKCVEWAEDYARSLRSRRYDEGADTLLRDFDQFITFYDFPKEHWIHIRTTNPLESIFAGVRVRTNVVKRFRKSRTALYMVFKLIERLSMNWKPIKGKDLIPLLIQGVQFEDGELVRKKAA